MYIIIVGAGQIGTPLIELATHEGHEVVVVEKEQEIAEAAGRAFDCLVINDDGTLVETLEQAGAERTDAIISTTDDDATNIMVMLLAQELEIPSKVSVVHNPEHMNVFHQIGINVIENPQQLIAEYLYRAVQRPSVKDFMHLGGTAEIFEITVTEDSEIAGKTLQEAASDGTLDDDVLVVALERNREVITPKGQTEIRVGDLATVFSKHGFEPRVLRVFSGPNR